MRLARQSWLCSRHSSPSPRRPPTSRDEQALAERFAPIVRLVEQEDVCGYGEPFMPTDMDLLLDEETVALRGPWNSPTW